ncbi:divalent-cation tolerance protein CutA [Dyella sp.]|uniref:divalent-cation tolerance protein CutA n=1 Tax=Dyella sp. TaxID=1869338 RepID=UPI002ED34D09
MSQILLCYCTCPSADMAQHLAERLVGESLAACVNLLPKMTSVYRWEGKVTTQSEALLLIKTTDTRFEALRQRLVELHPYDVPELIGVPVEHGHDAYLEWVRRET